MLTHFGPISLEARASSLSLSEPSKAVGSSKPSVAACHQMNENGSWRNEKGGAYQDEMRMRTYLAQTENQDQNVLVTRRARP